MKKLFLLLLLCSCDEDTSGCAPLPSTTMEHCKKVCEPGLVESVTQHQCKCMPPAGVKPEATP